MKLKVGILGGSFNPIHNGHIAFAKVCIDNLNLDKLYLVPTNITPLKNNDNFVTGLHRYNMCLLASKKYDKIKVSDIELKREGKSFTSDTLMQISEENPDFELYFILGADAFLSIEKWYQPERIYKSATLVTVIRENDDLNKIKALKDKLKDKNANIIILNKEIDMISSTKIRNALLNNQSVSEMLDTSVYEYIKNNNLYGV